MREQALHECDETTTHKLDGPGSSGKGTAHTLDETVRKEGTYSPMYTMKI